MIVKRKVLAYITQGNRLLVFEHPLSPEAGIQVPGGTLHDDETSEAGVMREAMEETGLTQLQLGAFLGETHLVIREQHYHRYFYHLYCEGETPQSWRHGEYDPSEGSATYIPFDFYWMPLVSLTDGTISLIGEQGALLPALVQRLNLS